MIDDGTDIVASHDYGPAMLACTRKQQLFVEAYMDHGGRPKKAVDAARDAGYSSANENTLRSAGLRLLHQPKIVQAIREEADLRVRAGAILGASVLIEIASDPSNKKQYNAAVELLNRADLIVASRTEITVDDKRPDKDELVGRVHELAQRLGIDPDVLLDKQQQKLIDVTPVEVEEEEW